LRLIAAMGLAWNGPQEPRSKIESTRLSLTAGSSQEAAP
jgi:hypothetical protein